MYYDPQRPIDFFLNQVKDFLEYRELAISPYTKIKMTKIAYTIVKNTRKFQDEIKTWNLLNPIKKGSILKPIFVQPTASLKKQANWKWRMWDTTNPTY